MELVAAAGHRRDSLQVSAYPGLVRAAPGRRGFSVTRGFYLLIRNVICDIPGAAVEGEAQAQAAPDTAVQ